MRLVQKLFFAFFVASFLLISTGTTNNLADQIIETESIATPADINVCDGVTCPDGSCAPTADQCTTTATISPDIYADSDIDQLDTDDDNDGIPDAVEDRPDYLDTDDDNDSVPTYIPPSIDALEVTAPSAAITTGDDAIDTAQDYNSTRSNKRENTIGDDIRDWNDQIDDAIRLIAEPIQDYPDADQDEYGDAAPSENQVTQTNRDRYGSYDCDGTAQRCIQIQTLSQEEKEAIRLRIQNNTRPEKEDLALAIAYNNSDNPAVREVRYNPETSDVEVLHDTQVRLLGFIKINTSAKTVINPEGIEKTSYPRWAFIARKGDSKRFGYSVEEGKKL